MISLSRDLLNENLKINILLQIMWEVVKWLITRDVRGFGMLLRHRKSEISDSAMTDLSTSFPGSFLYFEK